jgi:hypothetical protein
VIGYKIVHKDLIVRFFNLFLEYCNGINRFLFMVVVLLFRKFRTYVD